MKIFTTIAGVSAAWMLAALAAPPAAAQQQYPVAYAGTSQSKVYRIDMEDGCIDWVVTLPEGGVVQGVAASREGNLLTPPVLAATSERIYLLDGSGTLHSNRPYGVTASSYYQTTPIAIDSGGNYALAAHNDGRLRLYEIRQSPFEWVIVWEVQFDARSVAIDNVGLHAAATGPDGVAYFNHMQDGIIGWSSTDGAASWSHVLQGPAGSVPGMTVAITPSAGSGERYVAVGTQDKRVLLYDEIGSQKWSFDSPRGKYMSVAIDSYGELVTCGNDDPTNQQGAQLDGRPTPYGGGSSWTFVPSKPKSGDDCYALLAQHYAALSGELNWFASGGSGRYGVFVHDTDGTLVWSGNPVRQRHRLAVFHRRPFGYTYVVTGDINKPEVHVYKTDQKNPRHVVAIKGNCRALSTAWGPDVGTLGKQCPIGTTYCSSAVNSAGTEAAIYAMGSDVSSAGDLTLLATGCTPGMFGIFFHGLTPAQLPFQYGTLCVQPPIWRLPQVVSTGNVGAASLLVPGTYPPPGTTAYFQFWYRDVQHPTKARTSNAIEVTFK